MKRLFILFAAIILSFFYSCNQEQKPSRPDYVLVIHGGAGTILKEHMTPGLEEEYIVKLNEVLETGKTILESGGMSLDAVTACVMLMEDSPLFNAGKGSVFNAEGHIEMDASIMNGQNLKAGAVTGLKKVKNPVVAARAVMEKTDHVMLTSEGAETLAVKEGIEIVDPDYFFTEKRWKSFEREKQKAEKFGTVGAVALDQHGNLAAATSTGGRNYKMIGRVGDSPIVGAGTYADNNSCAVSATGHGEFFITNVVAYDIAALMKYKNLSLEDAASEVVMNKLVDQNAAGGIIAVDKNGNISMTFNTAGMYRGYLISDGQSEVLIYQD